MSGKQMTAKQVLDGQLKDVTIRVETAIASQSAMTAIQGQRFEALLSYKISRAAKAIDEVAKNFGPIQNAIVQKYGIQSTTKPGQYTYAEGQEAIAKEEMKKELSKEVIVKVIPLALEDFKGLQLPQEFFEDLDWLITE